MKVTETERNTGRDRWREQGWEIKKQIQRQS